MFGFGTVVILIMLTDLYPVHVFIPKNENHVRFVWMSVGVFNENKAVKVQPYVVKQIMQLKCRFCLFWLGMCTHTQANLHRHSQWCVHTLLKETSNFRIHKTFSWIHQYHLGSLKLLKESTHENFGWSQLIFGMYTTEVVNSGVGMNVLLITAVKIDVGHRKDGDSKVTWSYCHWNSVKKVVFKTGSDDKNVYMLAKLHLRYSLCRRHDENWHGT